ncbi:MAG: hypothetical protein CAF41_015440 [Nitrospira sp. CG24A]|mgnify:CR=1 FL=1|nr:MAG: hypothetical protein CAF41_015440 [Nitrospira sp. CG24A]
MVTHPSILLIEDRPGECELFRLALAQTGLDVTVYTEQDTEAPFRLLETQWMALAVVLSYWLNQGRSEGEAAGVVSTARVERGPSQAARSASTETMPATSPQPASSAPHPESV